jgi:hypothetical protein
LGLMGGNWPVVAGIWQEGAHPARRLITVVGGGSGLCQSHPRARALGDEALSQHPNCSPFLDRSAPLRGRPAPFSVSAPQCASFGPYPAVDIAYRPAAGDCLTNSNKQKGSSQCAKSSSLFPPSRLSACRAVLTPILSAASPAPLLERSSRIRPVATCSLALSLAGLSASPQTTLALSAANISRPSGRKTSPNRHGRLRAPVAVSHLKDLA